MKQPEELDAVIVYQDERGKWYEHNDYAEQKDYLELATWLEQQLLPSQSLTQKRKEVVAILKDGIPEAKDVIFRDKLEELLNGKTWGARMV